MKTYKHRILIGLVLSLLSPLSTAGEIAATTPVQQDAEWAASWWIPRHKEKLAEAKVRGEDVELLFIGDSITHGWDEGLWAENFTKFGAFNLGFSGDRTEHVLWRIGHGALENLSPKVTVIMIGTNNTGHGEGHPPTETAKGIEAIIEEIQERLPETKIILHAIFPRGATADDRMRKVNEEINEMLPGVAKLKGVEFLDINYLFVENDGTLPKNVMPDLLHPNKKGYQLWAAGLNPVLERHFGSKEEESPKEVIALWPTGVPAPHDRALVEKSEVGPRNGPRTVNRVTNVAEPSIKWYPAKGRRPRTTVLVFPGGAYNILAWDLEGEEVAEWLNSIGVSAAVLKYRVPKNREGALQDAQRALGLLRSKADEWNLDPERIGVLGFSAGGHLSATLSNHWRERKYPSVDGADDVSCRPDFTALVYPAYIGTPDFETAGGFSVDEEPPPAFIVQTQDDTKYFPSAIAYNSELLKRGIEVELHTFPTGGHGYGLRPSVYPVSGWKDLCRDWLLRR